MGRENGDGEEWRKRKQARGKMNGKRTERINLNHSRNTHIYVHKHTYTHVSIHMC